MDTATIQIPKTFWDDHRGRDCVEHTANPVSKATSRHYIVTLDLRDAADLYDDAWHYMSSAADYGFDMQGVVSSARATVQAIRKQFTHEQVCEWFTQWGATRMPRTW